jgi:NAD(P)-dependent dehydrogenase (short-subunit alcohol dehydrogenase family)
MNDTNASPVALVVGAGPGIGGAFAAGLVARGYRVALASRSLDKLRPLAASLDARAYAADAGEPASLVALFAAVERDLDAPVVVLYNPSARVRGPIVELDADAVARAVHATAIGAFVVAQEAAKRMLPRGRGALFFTGATASVKGFAQSSPFAMGKFAVRGLAQCLARELGPQGIHVAHFVIDGRVEAGDDPKRFTATNIARSYLAVLDQPPGAWSWEIELRANAEPF